METTEKPISYEDFISISFDPRGHFNVPMGEMISLKELEKQYKRKSNQYISKYTENNNIASSYRQIFNLSLRKHGKNSESLLSDLKKEIYHSGKFSIFCECCRKKINIKDIIIAELKKLINKDDDSKFKDAEIERIEQESIAPCEFNALKTHHFGIDVPSGRLVIGGHHLIRLYYLKENYPHEDTERKTLEKIDFFSQRGMLLIDSDHVIHAFKTKEDSLTLSCQSIENCTPLETYITHENKIVLMDYDHYQRALSCHGIDNNASENEDLDKKNLEHILESSNLANRITKFIDIPPGHYTLTLQRTLDLPKGKSIHLNRTGDCFRGPVSTETFNEDDVIRIIKDEDGWRKTSTKCAPEIMRLQRSYSCSWSLGCHSDGLSDLKTLQVEKQYLTTMSSEIPDWGDFLDIGLSPEYFTFPYMDSLRQKIKSEENIRSIPKEISYKQIALWILLLKTLSHILIKHHEKIMKLTPYTSHDKMEQHQKYCDYIGYYIHYLKETNQFDNAEKFALTLMKKGRLDKDAIQNATS